MIRRRKRASNTALKNCNKECEEDSGTKIELADERNSSTLELLKKRLIKSVCLMASHGEEWKPSRNMNRSFYSSLDNRPRT